MPVSATLVSVSPGRTQRVIEVWVIAKGLFNYSNYIASHNSSCPVEDVNGQVDGVILTIKFVV